MPTASKKVQAPGMEPKVQRLDVVMVARGLVATRSRARDVIERGLVVVGGRTATKAGQLVGDTDAILLDPVHRSYVSRGAEKLVAALDRFGFDPRQRTVLDIGASTGGFTEVVLERGAGRVYAIDVGNGQLNAALRDDPRVVTHEGLDARLLTAEHVPDGITGIVADVSFISLMKALPVPLGFAAAGCWFVALIKPQFEVGPAHVGKGGIVRNADARERAVADVTTWIAARPGWRVIGTCPSPIAGGDGNIETLIGAVFNG